MSVAVDVHAVQERMAEYGTTAYLVTVTEEGTPHVVSVTVRPQEDLLAMTVGQRTRANLERNPDLTLLWPAGADPTYSMIVDATLVSLADPAEIIVAPHSAVLHRVAGATGDGPTCLPVADPAD